MTDTIMERPPYPEFRMNHRACVHLWRRQAAWDLVHHKHEHVTHDEFDKAYDLLNRCIRYVLAAARHWENDNDSRIIGPNAPAWRRKEHEHKGELLERRLERLDNELAGYGVTFAWPGLYPCIVDRDEFRREHVIGREVCTLHYFD